MTLLTVTDPGLVNIFTKIFMENVRETAFKVLFRYFNTKENLKNLINSNSILEKIRNPDKALFFQLIKGVIRHYLTLDFLISEISGKDLKKIDKAVLTSLRMALYQIAFLTRIPAYSAVNESVSIIKTKRGQKSANFVNAVLRKTVSLGPLPELLKNNFTSIKDKNKKFSLKYSFPDWLICYWRKAYKYDNLEKLLASLNSNPEFFCRINTLKISEEAFYALLSGSAYKDFEIIPGWMAFKIKNKFEDFINSDFICEGLSYVQNASSLFAIKYFLQPEPGEKIMDICSAPGGKAITSAIMMDNTGEIIAIEKNSKKIELFKENLKRLSVKNIKIINADAGKEKFLSSIKKNTYSSSKEKSSRYKEYFDKIFIDAPCSAFGTISKNPDAKYNKNLKELQNYKENSLIILNNADYYLKKGGKIIFYTCTLSKIENEDVINDFMKSFKNSYKINSYNSLEKALKENERFFPGIADMDKTKKIIEIMPYHFGSEGASICELIKI